MNEVMLKLFFDLWITKIVYLTFNHKIKIGAQSEKNLNFLLSNQFLKVND